MKRLFAAIISISFAGFLMQPALSQISVVPLATDDQPDQHEGIYYALPKTFVRVDVWVDKKEILRGPFAEYASRLLGLDNVPRTNSVSYHLVGANMSTFHEADPDQFYFVRIPQKNAPELQFSLSPEGIMQSAGITESAKSKRTTADLREESPFRQEFIDINVSNIIERVDTFIRRISVDTTTFEEVFFRKTFIEKTTEQKAREAADFILKLEDHRFSLLTGYHEVNYSAEVMQFMNEQLKELQEEYLALFKGKTITTTSHFSFIFVPENDKEGIPETIFRFSPNRGVVDKDFPGGDAVQLTFRSAGNVASVQQHHPRRENRRRQQFGFFYRIPDKATLQVVIGNEVLTESEFLVSQLGAISFMPAYNIREVQFYPETGSLKHIRLK
jgi:hypothetical protein